MSLLSPQTKQRVSGLLQFINNLPQAFAPGLRAGPVNDPALAGMVDPAQQEALNERYAREYWANYATANARGLPWYALDPAATGGAQESYDQNVGRAAQIAEALRQRRMGDDRRAQYQKLVDSIADPKQRDLYSAMDPDAGTRAMIEDQRAAYAAQHPTDRYVIQNLGQGRLSKTDRTTGQTEFLVDPGYTRTASEKASDKAAEDTALMNDPGVTLMAYQMLGGQRPSTRSAKVLQAVAAKAMEIGQAKGIDPAELAVRIRQAGLDTHAMTKMNDNYKFVQTSEHTMQAHLDHAVELAKRIKGRLNVPYAEALRMKAAGNFKGDPDISAYLTALTEARNEYMKIMSGATLSVAGLSVHASETGESVFPDGMTVQQLISVANTAKKLAAQKREQFGAAVDDFNKGLRSYGDAPAPAAPAAAPQRSIMFGQPPAAPARPTDAFGLPQQYTAPADPYGGRYPTLGGQ